MNLFRKKSIDDFKTSIKKSHLKKELNYIDLACLGIGSVVGTGVFVSTGQGAKLAGPAVIISFIVAAVTCALCALTYSELATMFPVAGSTYSYCYVAFGEIIAWIIGWNLMLEYLVSGSAVASGWSSTFVDLLKSGGVNLPEQLTHSPFSGGIVDLPSMLIVAIITWILYIGVTQSSKINTIIVFIKIFVILVFIFIGVTHINPVNYHPFAPYGINGIMSGAAIIFFAFIGFDSISTAAEETSNPYRDVPIGLAICLGLTIILYIAVACVLTGMVPFKYIDVNNALPGALAKIGINWGSALVGTGAVIGMISTILVILYGQVRIFMVMARDGLLPKVFSSINESHRTPGICTIVTGCITALICGFFPLNIIIELCNIGTLSAFLFVSAGIIVLRKTMPDIQRKFRCPGVPFTPILTILFCIYLMISLPSVTWIRFLIWTGAGLAIYFLYGMKNSLLNKENN
ncbi:MAG: amino acid permease [Clostridium sp.]|jgi:APA family basic amino acid/polyamine antiporter|uniref:amino acid permease n=1 Tax=Clostridium sp. TaxID=1506 RepID=UPI0025BB5F3F|nr:amino acid permease [Clostridium sp.]MCH3963374.1 amino acid permease [Clostridium sp.]MCI1716758.1 amino acid permease [Clostridium sp.]MCI1801058.1 amino acid permease [Clostridium sp.]MCI1814944.1 amino acid permease [Clostridium sp.]MCI1871845.1 amino acid permease [Clostridium sp.]